MERQTAEEMALEVRRLVEQLAAAGRKDLLLRAVGVPLPDDGSHPEVTQRLRGAFHSSDLWFVFKSLKHCWRPWTKGDWDLSEKMLTAWTNFVKYSDPNGPKGGAWAPCTEKTPSFMVFKLDDKDAEASFFGEPEKAPNQGFGFGGFPGGARPGGAGAPGASGAPARR